MFWDHLRSQALPKVILVKEGVGLVMTIVKVSINDSHEAVFRDSEILKKGFGRLGVPTDSFSCRRIRFPRMVLALLCRRQHADIARMVAIQQGYQALLDPGPGMSTARGSRKFNTSQETKGLTVGGLTRDSRSLPRGSPPFVTVRWPRDRRKEACQSAPYSETVSWSGLYLRFSPSCIIL